MAAAGRKPPKRRRRKSRGARWSKSPRRPPPPPPPSAPPGSSSSSPVPEPLPTGAEVEVRVDAHGFGGSWFEATVVGFAPARGPRTPARYTVTYEHLLADDGGGVLAEHFAPTHIRPRPPPPSEDFPPRFRLHDIVEAFHKDGWWSGIVVRAPGSPDPGATVTVAFPLTREVIPFPPRLVRPRRDYVGGGGWVPSRSVVAVRPERKVRVYQVGEKVEARRDRDVYGYSWFPATVSKVVDDFSYIVEYFDLDEEGDGGTEKATEYLEWRFIRPAVEHLPHPSEFQLVPGAAVEAYCDGAWSPGVICRAVGDGEFEVSILGKKAEQLVTRVVELLKPQYKWDGKQWKIVAAKRRANLRRQSMSGQNLSSPVDLLSNIDDYTHDPESAGTKKSRKKSQQLDVLLAENSGSLLSEKNSLQVTSHGVVSSVPMNGHLCASPGHSTPQNESMPNSTGETVDNQEVLSEMMDSDGHLNTRVFGASAGDAHDMLSIAELRKNMASARRSSSVQQIQKKVDNQEVLSEMMDSDGHLNTRVFGASAGDAHDMLSIAELRKNMASARRSSSVQQIQKKVLSVKTLKVKKGISKSKGTKTHPILELEGKNDASDNIQLKGNIDFSSTVIVCGLNASVEDQTNKTPDRRVTRQTIRGPSSKVLTCKKLAKRKGPRELCSPLSSLDVTSTVQQRGRKKLAGPMKESPLAEQLDKTLEDTLNTTELSDQDTIPMIPPGFESMYDGKGVDIHGSLSEEEPTAIIDSISQVNLNADADHAATQVAKSNHLMETGILSVDHPVPKAGRKVDERSILPRLHNASSSQCTMDNSSLRSCSASGSSMPSHLPASHVQFVKNSPMWSLIEEMNVFCEVPQHPHFLPLRQFPPGLREGMALGLMVSFADTVKLITQASIDHSMEWFEDTMNTLSHLERNGFDVQFLQSTLTKLLHIKSDSTNCLGEIQKLNSQIVGVTASSSRIDKLLDEKDRAIAELEQKLGRLRQESQKIAKDKEHQEVEIFGLQSARSRFEEAHNDAKRQFHNVLDELRQKRLT
ncbi:hypothetical protein SETIT_8G151100v2 [Setaria italica]|nr:DUF724 domain-containing protein 3 isoform X1 [Setaria italica]RCV38544.1 hypothetical protein SETIT_8G151100v2 [Setaria italica]